MDDKQLPKAQHDRIFETRILPDSGLDRLQPAPEGLRPHAIVLAGQPGA